MRTKHKHRALYIHEKTSLSSATAQRYAQAFAEHYRPAMEGLGARLFGFWQANPFNSNWPEITTIWEIDGYAHYGDISKARLADPAFAEWDEQLAAMGAHGEGRLCYANDRIKLVSELREDNYDSSVVIEEIMVTKPGGQERYVEQLEYLYVPWSERTGKKWLGSFVTVFRNDEVIHYWALEGGWDGFGKWYPAWKGDIPADIKSWMTVAPAIRDTWDDSMLGALPGHPFKG